MAADGGVMKGWLMKRSQQLLQWRWRYVSLTGSKLCTFTTEKEDVLTNEVELQGVEVEAADFYLAAPLKYGFMVVTRDKTLRFAAETPELREEWMRAIAEPPEAAPPEAAAPAALAEPAPGGSPAPAVPKKGVKGPGKGPKGKSKGKGGPKGKGPGKGPPVPLLGKAAPKKASVLPLGRRLSVRMLTPAEAAMEAAEETREEPCPVEVDLEALRNAFGTSSRSSSSKQTPRLPAELGLELLPRREAQNVAIVLKKLRRDMDLDTEGLATSLDQLHPGDCVLPAEECERFIQVLPAPELLRPLKEYSQDISKLRDIERELLPLAKLTRLRERLRLLWLFKTLDKRLTDAMQQMTLVQSACNDVRSSEVLRSLLQIIEVLFNYINYGQAPGGEANRRRVDVQSLTHLVETRSDPERAPFPKFHMLHFCIQDLLKQHPTFTLAQAEEELRNLAGAAFVNLAHEKLALENLQEDLKFVQTELYGHREEYRKKEEVTTPTSEGPPKAVTFDLEENDTASEDEMGRETSEDSIQRERSPRRSTVGQLVSQAIDTFSFAEDWWHGSAIIGVNEKGGPDAVLPPDGVPPPPGMLQRWRPSGRCKPYLCEVRGALLVLYRVKTFTSSASLRGTFYVVLPGAELQLLDSLYATDFARQLARERNSSGLELQTTDGRTEYLLAKTAKETTRWMDFLTSRSQQWDAGFVSHYLGWGFISSCWRRLLCVLDRPNRRLLGFSQVRNYAEGLKPDYCWELPSNANVYAFDAEKSSAAAKGLLSVAPSGFEIELSDEQRLQFSCDSVQHLHRWLEELRKCLQPPILTDFLSESNDPVRPRRMTGAMTGTAAPLREAELFDLFAEQSPSKPSTAKNLSFSVVEAGPSLPSTPSGHRPEQLRKRLMLSVGAVEGEPDTPREKSVERANSDDEVPPRAALVATSSFCALGDLTKPEQVPDALSQLHQLEVELQGVVETWSRTLLATEADGRALLRSFGLNAQPETLHDASQQLLQALSTFQQQLRVAWAEVEQHRAGRPCASPRKPLGHAVRADAEAKPEAAALAEHDASCGGSASASSDATVSDAEECASFVSAQGDGTSDAHAGEEWIQAELEPQAKSAPSAPSPAAPKKGGKGPKGPGPKGDGRGAAVHKGKGGKEAGKGPKGPPAAKGKGKGPPPPGGKGVPKQASALPLGRRLSVRMLTPGEAALAEEEEPGEVEVDLEALRHTFGPAASSKQPPSSNSRVTQELGVELLPRREAQNVAIVLKKLRRDTYLDTEGLAASLDQLKADDCPLPAEECERFIQVLPAPELLRPLAEYSKDVSKLRDIERDLLPLAKLTRLRERLQLLWLFKTLEKRLSDALQPMRIVQSACAEVRKSSVLRSLLQIIEVLFNYINYGQTPAKGEGRSTRRRVDVQSLTHLVETRSDPGRAPFPKFHMLHFCIKDLLKQHPDFTMAQVEEELRHLSDASVVNLAHEKLALGRLQEDLQFVKTELHSHREDYQKARGDQELPASLPEPTERMPSIDEVPENSSPPVPPSPPPEVAPEPVIEEDPGLGPWVLVDDVNGTELFEIFADPSPSTTGQPHLSFSVDAAPGDHAQAPECLKLSVGGGSTSRSRREEVASEEATCSSANAGCAEKHAVRSPECPVEKAPSLAPSLCGLGGFFRGLTKKEEKVPDALSQLERLEVEMDRVVVQWTKTLAATEADCRALLRFFRLGGTTVDAELHEASQQLLQALSTFQQQLRVAWTEVEHHEKPKSSPRRREKLGEAPDTESEETASESEKSFVKSLKRLAPRGERVAGRGPR
ncbi:unnamed protein product [Durusdinium trenchii]|uniref:Formin-like protein n=1 Tax=Durusdinium trenchii TaxID=1381693 RepID=A0ABP0HMB2_9DINO